VDHLTPQYVPARTHFPDEPEFHDKLAKLRFFDPACGCGNFLVITYRELRKLELEVLLVLYGQQHEMSLDDVNKLSKVNVHQFYGIEIEELPLRGCREAQARPPRTSPLRPPPVQQHSRLEIARNSPSA
jgi:hypothetical protein